MKIVREERDGETILRLVGGDALDYANAADVKASLRAAFDGERELVVDLSEVAFIDSAGIGCLIAAFKAAHAAGRKARFLGVRPAVMEVLSIVRLDRLLDFRADGGDRRERAS